MQFTITHHGVPVGTTEFTMAAERFVVPVRPLPGYTAIRPLVRAASVALAGVALSGTASVESGALRRGAEWLGVTVRISVAERTRTCLRVIAARNEDVDERVAQQ